MKIQFVKTISYFLVICLTVSLTFLGFSKSAYAAEGINKYVVTATDNYITFNGIDIPRVTSTEEYTFMGNVFNGRYSSYIDSPYYSLWFYVPASNMVVCFSQNASDISHWILRSIDGYSLRFYNPNFEQGTSGTTIWQPVYYIFDLNTGNVYLYVLDSASVSKSTGLCTTSLAYQSSSAAYFYQYINGSWTKIGTSGAALTMLNNGSTNYSTFQADILYSTYSISGFYEADTLDINAPDPALTYQYLWQSDSGYVYVDSAGSYQGIDPINGVIYFNAECNKYVYASSDGYYWTKLTTITTMYGKTFTSTSIPAYCLPYDTLQMIYSGTSTSGLQAVIQDDSSYPAQSDLGNLLDKLSFVSSGSIMDNFSSLYLVEVDFTHNGDPYILDEIPFSYYFLYSTIYYYKAEHDGDYVILASFSDSYNVGDTKSLKLRYFSSATDSYATDFRSVTFLEKYSVNTFLSYFSSVVENQSVIAHIESSLFDFQYDSLNALYTRLGVTNQWLASIDSKIKDYSSGFNAVTDKLSGILSGFDSLTAGLNKIYDAINNLTSSSESDDRLYDLLYDVLYYESPVSAFSFFSLYDDEGGGEVAVDRKPVQDVVIEWLQILDDDIYSGNDSMDGIFKYLKEIDFSSIGKTATNIGETVTDIFKNINAELDSETVTAYMKNSVANMIASNGVLTSAFAVSGSVVSGISVFNGYLGDFYTALGPFSVPITFSLGLTVVGAVLNRKD